VSYFVFALVRINMGFSLSGHNQRSFISVYVWCWCHIQWLDDMMIYILRL